MLRFLASERGIKNLGITWKNIVTDYGATSGGTGTANGDYTAFKAFHDWALLQSGWVGLELPPSSGSAYYGVNGAYTYLQNYPFFGIPKLVVMGYGAAMNGLHGAALTNNNTGRAAIDTVAAGSYTLNLKDVGDATKFTEGGMILLAGLDLQQGYGYPPNPHYFEWNRIVDISGTSITLETPTTQEYRDDWPRFFEGNANELGGFGPATICRTNAGWDCHHKIYGVRSKMAGQTYYFVRKAELFDVRNDEQGFIIGAGRDHKIINQIHTTSNHEVDKLCETALIGEYDGVSNVNVQSSSIGYLHIRGGTRSISGTARSTLIEGGSSSTITLAPVAYGIAEQVTIRNKTITIGISGSFGFSKTLGANLTYEGDGLFRFVDPGVGSNYWAVPGAVGMIITTTPFYMHSPFRVLSVYSEDGLVDGATMMQTTLTGPDLPVVTGETNASLVRHPAPDLTVENCVGSASALELSLAPPSSPYGVFTRRTFDGAVASNSLGTVVGRLVHLKVNVTQAYTGVASALNIRFNQFDARFINADMTTQRPGVIINLKVAGERVITPSGVTGEQSGDGNLSALTGGVWMPLNAGFSAYIGNNGSAVDISGESAGVRPIVTVEILTDQEF